MRVVAIVLSTTILIFMGAAAYAVVNGAEGRQSTCDAVKGLRTDLVEIIEEQRGRALENAEKLGLNTQQLDNDYNRMLNKIGDPQCP